MARLIVVSNRVPDPKERGARAGGLAVALADALPRGSLWFGWSGRRAAATAATATLAEADGITYATIDLGETDYRRFYVGFANGALWPLLHFRLGLMSFLREDYEGYRAVNRGFAAALAPLLRPDDLIWVHDYHLIPLGQELRRLGVANRIGFFLHVPFVPPAILQVLPRAGDLLAALCACDVVGFHTDRYRDAFLDCCAEWLGARPDRQGRFDHAGRNVQAVVTPVGIDAEDFAQLAMRAVRGVEARRLKDSLVGRALAIGVDRLDYSKGLLNRIEAFARLLATHPEHRRRVSLLQVAARSREEVDDYQRLRRELDRVVGDTNGRFSEFDWAPVRYVTRPIRRRTLAGFYRLARLGVVTPLRDGMNLVAKEFVAAQNPADPGVLILSRFAGAADAMAAALVVNPFDAEEVAEAMDAALTMGLPERQERHQALRTEVWSGTAAAFCASFLQALRLPGGGAA